MTWKEAGQLMLGTAALITAVNATCNNRTNSERIDKHRDEIATNAEHIESTKDTVAVNAKVLNSVAESVGIPPVATSPPVSTTKE